LSSRHALAALAAATLACGGAFAQEPPSSTQLGVSVGSGARALGMGGAFIAVADDASAASWNPAGLAILQRPEASFVWKALDRQTQSIAANTSAFRDASVSTTASFTGSVERTSSRSPDFVSISYPFRIHGMKFVGQLDYQRAIELGYHRRTLQRGATVSHSRRALLGGPPGLEDTTTSSALDDRETGGVDVLVSSLAASVHPKLLFGVSLNFWRNGSVLEESSAGETVACSASLAATGARSCSQDESKLSGSARQGFAGVSVNLGAIVRPTRKLRLGLVFKGPFTMELERLRSFESDLEHRGPDGNANRFTRFTRRENGSIEWPATLGAGVAFQPQDALVLSADVTTTLWSRARYRYRYDSETVDGNPAPQSYNTVERYTENAEVLWPTRTSPSGFAYDPSDPYRARRQNDTYQARFGLEYLVTWKTLAFPLRAGTFLDRQFFTDTDGGAVLSRGVSAGVGVSWKNLSLDAAFVRQEMHYSLDYSERVPSRGIELQELQSSGPNSVTSSRLYLSAIVRF